MNDRSSTLAILPALSVRLTSYGKVAITHKFVNGMRKYQEGWDGPITAFMRPSQSPTTELDEYETDPSDLPFKLEVVQFNDPGLGQMLAGHKLVLSSVEYRQTHLAKVCRSIGVPCVYVSEYSLKTRCQVIRAAKLNPIISLRRYWWEYWQDRRYRTAIRMAAGVQCNGTPTFEEYRTINANPLLFFDTRASEDMLISPEEIEKRGEVLLRRDPIRLLFSGRLIAMKGADHLVPVAVELRKRGVPFQMTICGGGNLEARIKADIERLGLSDVVKLAGVLRFREELTPLTKHHVDLFVCCHTTGDPAGTYLDVMCCGVPFIGYNNEALDGIVRESGVGWTTPMSRPDKLADKIAEIEKDRPALLDASKKAIEFARLNTFDRVFKARIEHMKSCCEPNHARLVAH